MPIYTMQAPNGKTYDIEGPEGASEEDVRAEILRSDPAAGQASAPDMVETAAPIEPLSVSPSTTPAPEASTENMWSIENQGGWGLSPETRRALGAGGPIETLRPLTDLPANVADLGYRGIQAVQAGIGELGVGADEIARRTGLADALGNSGGKFLPGTAMMGLMEAIPDPSLLGSTPNVLGRMTHNARLAPDVEAGLSQMFKTGTTDEIVSYARQAGRDIDPESVAQFVKERDAGTPISTKVQYLPDTVPVEGEVGLPGQMANEGEVGIPGPQFRPKEEVPAAPVEDVDSTGRTQQNVIDELADEFGIKNVEKALTEDDFRAQVNAQLASEEMPQLPKKASVADEYVPSKLEQEVADHADALAKDWTNAPEVSVYDHFDDAGEGIDKNALGVYDPESGQVLLNSKMIEKEAAKREISIQEMTNTVLFHEGLGHYGLAQKFRGDLDGTLHNWYQTSPNFRQRVNDWLTKHADDYADEDQIARAAEEVLAEMSEKGRIPAKLVDKIKNLIKTSARQLGFEWDVSMREIKTVLDQAHSAVISGKKYDVRGNGFRSMRPTAANDDRISLRDKPRLEQGADKKKYYEDVAKWHEARARQFRQEGNIRKAENHESSARTNNDLAARLDPEYKSQSSDRAKYNREQAEYHDKKIKQRGVMGDTKGVAYHTAERDRFRKLASQYAEQGLNNPRSMKSTYGESEGSVQGRAGRENKEGDRTTINHVRSNRNIEDILDEAAPVKEGQTHEEWINDAGRIKNVGKVAQSLAKGTEPAELLAAEEYAVRSANRIFDLSRKAANETLSPRELHILEREQNRLKNVLQSIDDVKANAGRILNASKIEVGSDKVLTDTMRRMLANADLSTEEGRAAANAAIDKAKISEARKKVLRNINNAISNILNLPFAMMSTLDLSAPFRQGRSLAHTKQFWKSMVPMIKMAAKSDNFKAYMAEIQSRPTFKMMEDSGLFLADVGKQLSKREERFMTSWASKIPGFGRAVRFSERGYVGFLNKLRADTFDDLVRKAKDAGIDYTQDPEGLKKLSSFVNAATGRGNIPGGGDSFGPILNGLFFSPRLMASRVKLLNPVTYATLPPVVRKEAIKSLLATGGTSLAAGYLASLAGADLELDPRSSDFMKIKTGDTRYDTLGGFGQYVTLGARLFSNEKKNAKGDIVELGKKFGSDTRWDVSMDFLSNKFSPLASLVKDWMKGKDFQGQPFEAKKAIIERFIPLFAQDVYDAYQQEGAVGAVKAAPGFIGFGAQTYAGPTGTDVYGRSYETERVDTPEITEIKRLEELEGNTIVNPPRKKVGDKTLTEEEFNQYQELAGQYIVQDLQQEMQSEDWQYYTDEEKIDLIKQIARDQRTNAREELFGNDAED